MVEMEFCEWWSVRDSQVFLFPMDSAVFASPDTCHSAPSLTDGWGCASPEMMGVCTPTYSSSTKQSSEEALVDVSITSRRGQRPKTSDTLRCHREQLLKTALTPELK